MIRNSNSPRGALFDSTKLFPDHLKYFFSLMLLALWTASAVAASVVVQQTPDDQYLQILRGIDQADTLNNNGKPDDAKVKYREAQTALLNFKRSFPAWNVKMVSYRLNYLSEKIAALTPKAPLPPPPSATAAGTGAGNKASSALDEAQFKVLEAGVEPRSVRRYRTKVGDKQTVVITAKLNEGEGQGRMSLPAFRITMSALPKTVSEGGDTHFDVIIEDVGIVDETGVAPELIAMVKGMSQMVKGLVVVSVMSDRGVYKSSEVKIPPGTSPEARAAMEQMKLMVAESDFVLPEEAIGPGAKWEVKRKTKSEGAMVDETGTHELVSAEGDVLTIRSAVVKSAANQKISHPMMPNATIDLVKLTASVSMNSKIDLAKVLPSQATVQERSERTMRNNQRNQSSTVTSKSDSTVQMETK